MDRLIRDIQPRRPTIPPGKRAQAIQQRIRRVHHATNLPRLYQASYQRASFDVVTPRNYRARSDYTVAPARPPSRLAGGTVVRQPAAQAVQPAAASKTVQKPRLLRRMADFAQYPLIAAIAIGAAYSSTAGQVMILLFAVVCLLVRLSSSYSFGAALLLLAGVPLFQLLHQSGVSQNAAIYAYELLVTGTVLAIIEQLRASRAERKHTKAQRLVHKSL